jgi:hypothetical protein
MCKFKHCLVTGLAFACIISTGCGGGSSSVEGTVTLDGQPLSNAQVGFTSTTAPPGKLEGVFTGLTDERGHYSLTPASDSVSGVPSGTYRVTISTAFLPPGTPDQDRQQLPPERVPANYRNGSVTVDIPEGGKKDVDFKLTTK